jgi:hypothetical protein
MTFKTTVQARTQSATAIPVTEEILATLGPAKRPLLRVTINRYSYTARVGIMNGERLIPASADVRKRAGIAAGDEITVDIEPEPDGGRA